MKILVLDCNIDLRHWGAADIRQYSTLAPGSRFEVRRTPQLDLPTQSAGYQGVVITGSFTRALEDAPWIEKLLEFLKRCFEQGIPVLGICYGQQMISRALGGKKHLREASIPEFGWARIERVDTSRILTGLPKKFYSFASHYDEVSDLPPGAIHTARSEACRLQAFEIAKKPIYAVQFHPEKELRSAEVSYQEHLQGENPHPFLNASRGARLYNPKIGEQIFQNFLQICHNSAIQTR